MQLKPGDTFAVRYHLIRQIGVGGFAEVWLAQDQWAKNIDIALKIYALDSGVDQAGIKQFTDEYADLVKLSHPNILKADHFDIWESRPYLVLKLCSGGSLADQMRKAFKDGGYKESQVRNIVQQIATGLNYLHQMGVVHRDLKPQNILIDDQGDYLISDFGISSQMRSTFRNSLNVSKLNSMTPAYASPEAFNSLEKPVPANDIFSLGVIIAQLCSGDVPWMGHGGIVLRPDSLPLKLPHGYSSSLEKLMQRCLQFYPGKRITAAQILKELNGEKSTSKEGNSWKNIFSAKSDAKDNNVGKEGNATQRMKTKETPQSPANVSIQEHKVIADMIKDPNFRTLGILAMVGVVLNSIAFLVLLFSLPDPYIATFLLVPTYLFAFWLPSGKLWVGVANFIISFFSWFAFIIFSMLAFFASTYRIPTLLFAIGETIILISTIWSLFEKHKDTVMEPAGLKTLNKVCLISGSIFSIFFGIFSFEPNVMQSVHSFDNAFYVNMFIIEFISVVILAIGVISKRWLNLISLLFSALLLLLFFKTNYYILHLGCILGLIGSSLGLKKNKISSSI